MIWETRPYGGGAMIMVIKSGDLLRQNKYCNKTFFLKKSNIIYSYFKKYGFHPSSPLLNGLSVDSSLETMVSHFITLVFCYFVVFY